MSSRHHDELLRADVLRARANEKGCAAGSSTYQPWGKCVSGEQGLSLLERQVAVLELEGNFKRLSERLNEHISEFKGTSLAVALGVGLKMRGGHQAGGSTPR